LIFSNYCLIADELIQTSNGTTDTFLNLGARLRSPSSWPWRLITVLMIIRLLQGKERKNFLKN